MPATPRLRTGLKHVPGRNRSRHGFARPWCTDCWRYIVGLSEILERMLDMSSTYALGSPWLWFARHCGPEQKRKADWLASMTARRDQRSGHQFAGWGMFGGQPPFGPPWATGGPTWRTPKARRGDVRAAIFGVLADQSDERLPDHPGDRRAQRWGLEAEPRLDLPDPAAARGRGPRLRGRGGWSADLRVDRRRSPRTSPSIRTSLPRPGKCWASPMATRPGSNRWSVRSRLRCGRSWRWAAASSRPRPREALIELRRKLHAILAEGDDTSEQS